MDTITILTILVALIVILFIFNSFVQSRKMNALSATIETVALKEGKREKKGFRKALKTVVKAFKMLMNQAPIKFENNGQLRKFNMLMKNDDGSFMLYTADDVVGKELLEALEDLGIDYFVSKI